MDAASWVYSLLRAMHRRRRVASIAVATLWALWCERNRRIFRAEARPHAVVSQLIIDELQLWSMAGGTHLSLGE